MLVRIMQFFGFLVGYRTPEQATADRVDLDLRAVQILSLKNALDDAKEDAFKAKSQAVGFMRLVESIANKVGIAPRIPMNSSGDPVIAANGLDDLYAAIVKKVDDRTQADENTALRAMISRVGRKLGISWAQISFAPDVVPHIGNLERVLTEAVEALLKDSGGIRFGLEASALAILANDLLKMTGVDPTLEIPEDPTPKEIRQSAVALRQSVEELLKDRQHQNDLCGHAVTAMLAIAETLKLDAADIPNGKVTPEVIDTFGGVLVARAHRLLECSEVRKDQTEVSLAKAKDLYQLHHGALSALDSVAGLLGVEEAYQPGLGTPSVDRYRLIDEHLSQKIGRLVEVANGPTVHVERAVIEGFDSVAKALGIDGQVAHHASMEPVQVVDLMDIQDATKEMLDRIGDLKEKAKSRDQYHDVLDCVLVEITKTLGQDGSHLIDGSRRVEASEG